MSARKARIDNLKITIAGARRDFVEARKRLWELEETLDRELVEMRLDSTEKEGTP